MSEGEKRVWVVGSGTVGRRDQIRSRFQSGSFVSIGPLEGGSNDALKRVSRFKGETGEVNEGDFVILRSGTMKIAGVGVLGPYSRDEDLAISGWDLGHVRSVTWGDLYQDKLDQLFSKMTNKAFGRNSFHELGLQNREVKQELQTILRKYDVPVDAAKRSERVDVDEFVEALVKSERGEVVDETRLREAVDYASDFGNYAASVDENMRRSRSEAETVALVLIPLLRALGIPPSRIGVEVSHRVAGSKNPKRLDLVVFREAGSNELQLVIEAKRRWSGLDGAASQIEGYLKDMGPVDWMVTDGADFIFSNGGERLEANLSYPNRSGGKLFAALLRSVREQKS